MPSPLTPRHYLDLCSRLSSRYPRRENCEIFESLLRMLRIPYRSLIVLCQDEGIWQCVRINSEVADEFKASPNLIEADPLFLEALGSRQPILEVCRPLRAPLREASAICFPMYDGKAVVGLVYLGERKPMFFSEDQVERLLPLVLHLSALLPLAHARTRPALPLQTCDLLSEALRTSEQPLQTFLEQVRPVVPKALRWVVLDTVEKTVLAAHNGEGEEIEVEASEVAFMLQLIPHTSEVRSGQGAGRDRYALRLRLAGEGARPLPVMIYVGGDERFTETEDAPLIRLAGQQLAWRLRCDRASQRSLR